MKKIIWIAIVVMIAAGLVAARITRVREKENAPLVPDIRVAVDTATLTTGKVIRTHHMLGTVIAADEVDVAPRIMAQVLAIKVREGDRVARGDVLAILDGRELEDAVAQAEAGVLAAREELTAVETANAAQRDATARDRRLHDANAISDEQWEHSQSSAAAASAHLEAARAQVEIAVKRLDQTRTRLSYCNLKAPVDGVVAKRLADPGDLGVPGRPLLELVSQSAVRIRAEAPAEDLASLAVGRPVTLSLGDTQIDASISRVFPALSGNHLVAFEVDIKTPSPGFVSGARVGVDVELGSAEGLRAPASALLEGTNGAWVFTVVDSVVHPVKVEVLDRSLDEVVIDGALADGATVVVARPARLMTLADGMEVSVAAEAA